MKKLFFTLVALLFVYAASAQCTASFSYTIDPGNPLDVTVTNTSTYTPVPGSTPLYWIIWGDGSPSTILSSFAPGASHTYTAGGSYLISLFMTYYDTLNNVVWVCDDSTSQMVTVSSSLCTSTITSADNGGGSYTFTANNSNSGMSYSWDFGDGNTGTGSPVTHSYTASGNYTVTLTTTGSGCTDSTSTTVSYFDGTLDCNLYTASFTYNANGYNVNFINTSTSTANIPSNSVFAHSSWDFGDGTSSNSYYASHQYAAAGTYTVVLTTNWVDSTNNNVLCTNTYTGTVTVTPPPNKISGYILWDSTNTQTAQASFKVWLIVHDTVANTLAAIDSTVVAGWLSSYYEFNNYPAGSYRTKAALVPGTSSGLSLVPTYHSSTVHWTTASIIYHTGGNSQNKNIFMIPGTPAPGSGFIGGNISAGANKGTSTGVPNLLVVLRNEVGDVIRFTYTDANGDYAFGNIATGNYEVYPEAMNYFTTLIPVTLQGGSMVTTNVDFVKTATEIKPKTLSVNNLPEGELFSVYPNPANDVVYVRTTNNNSNIVIADVSGRVVMNQTGVASGIAKLDVSNLNNGVYFIKVMNGNAHSTEKLILQR